MDHDRNLLSGTCLSLDIILLVANVCLVMNVLLFFIPPAVIGMLACNVFVLNVVTRVVVVVLVCVIIFVVVDVITVYSSGSAS